MMLYLNDPGKFVLPKQNITLKTMPISTNKLYQGRRFLTKEGKSNKEALGWEAKEQWMNKAPLEGKISVTVRYYFKDGRKLDIDNVKALWDSLKGIVYKDDTQIWEMHSYQYVDKQNPRVELTFSVV